MANNQDAKVIEKVLNSGTRSKGIEGKNSGQESQLIKPEVNYPRGGIVVQDYSGKVLKRQKTLIANGVSMIARTGSKWEELPLNLRQGLQFSEDDFR